VTETPTEGAATSYAPQQSYQWLRPFIPKRMQPMLRGVRKRSRQIFVKLDEPYRSVYPFSQVNLYRQKNLVQLAEIMDAENVPGAIVECGVLDGGTAALMAWASRNSQPTRPIHLYDAWEGLPETTAEDGAEAVKWSGQVVGSPTRVLAIMNKLGIDPNRINVHRGWFEDTFPHVDVEQVALIHIDCDFYAPTRLCLETWYPRISPGGAIQFDDYAAFSGCAQAVDEFLATHPEVSLERSPTAVEAYYLRKPR
jgi:O-methyltransferase